MTRDEIMQLSADELRVAIAEARGYKWRRWEGMPGIWEEALRRDEDFVYVAVKENGRITVSFDMPDWTGDIAEAWPLFLEMIGGGADVAISRGWNGGIDCDVLRPEIAVNELSGEMAISRCWLIWHEETRK